MAETVTVKIPVAEPMEGAYQPTRIDFRLTPKETETSRRIYDGLCGSGAQKSPGHYVESHADVYRWLLKVVDEEIASSNAEEKAKEFGKTMKRGRAAQ